MERVWARALEPAPLPRRERRQGSNTPNSPASKTRSTLGDTLAATCGARHKTARSLDVCTATTRPSMAGSTRQGVSAARTIFCHTRLLFIRSGRACCWRCGRPEKKQTNWAGVSLWHARSAATALVYRLPREGVADAAGGAVGRQKMYKLGGVGRSILGPFSR